MSACALGEVLLRLSGGPFRGSNRQRLRPSPLGPPAIPWPKGCLGTVSELDQDLVRVFPIRSTAFFLLQQQNHTSSTPHVWCSRLPRSLFAATTRPATALTQESAQGAQGEAEVWAVNQREGGTKVLGIWDQASLTRWTPSPPRDALPFSRSRPRSWAREQEPSRVGWSRVGRSARLPGSPQVPRLQRDVARGFQFSFFLLRVLEQRTHTHTLASAPPTPPPCPRGFSSCRPKINIQCWLFQTRATCFALCVQLHPSVLSPLESSFLLFSFSLSLFFQDPRAVRTPHAGCRPLPAF